MAKETKVKILFGVEPKPPLGPEPEETWIENRMWHLIERLAGFAGKPSAQIDRKWLIELRDRIDDTLGNLK